MLKTNVTDNTTVANLDYQPTQIACPVLISVIVFKFDGYQEELLAIN